MLQVDWQGILDQIDQGLLLIRDNRVVFINQICAEILKVSPEKALNRLPIEVLRNYRLEAIALRGGEIEIDLSGRLIKAKGIRNGLIITDISQTKQRERELKQTVAILSHEFRTPVAAIKGLLEVLALEPPEEQRKHFFSLANSEIDRLVRLVDDLAVGFRLSNSRTFIIKEVIDRVLLILADKISKRQVKIDISGEDTVVNYDPDKLVQVFLNLLDNALRYGPNSGTIWLKIEVKEQVEVRVIDSGKSLVNYDFLFGAEQRGAVEEPGSGLGLYIVLLIVKSVGGRVWARHTAIGNEFGFTIPKQDAKQS